MSFAETIVKQEIRGYRYLNGIETTIVPDYEAVLTRRKNLYNTSHYREMTQFTHSIYRYPILAGLSMIDLVGNGEELDAREATVAFHTLGFQFEEMAFNAFDAGLRLEGVRSDVFVAFMNLRSWGKPYICTLVVDGNGGIPDEWIGEDGNYIHQEHGQLIDTSIPQYGGHGEGLGRLTTEAEKYNGKFILRNTNLMGSKGALAAFILPSNKDAIRNLILNNLNL